MSRYKTIIALLAILLFSRVEAKQPISESLVDCAALFTISTRAFPERQTAKARALNNAATTLTRAAQTRAATEEQSDPQGYVDKLLREKRAKWDARGVNFIFSEEFREWASYCRSLSKHLGISLKPPEL